jgi:hypothetical protein
MIYTDGTHLMSDNPIELHVAAESIGLKKKWFQHHPEHPHYDIMSDRLLKKAIEKGAKLMSTKKMLRRYHIQTKGAPNA